MVGESDEERGRRKENSEFRLDLGTSSFSSAALRLHSFILVVRHLYAQPKRPSPPPDVVGASTARFMVYEYARLRTLSHGAVRFTARAAVRQAASSHE